MYSISWASRQSLPCFCNGRSRLADRFDRARLSSRSRRGLCSAARSSLCFAAARSSRSSTLCTSRRFSPCAARSCRTPTTRHTSINASRSEVGLLLTFALGTNARQTLASSVRTLTAPGLYFFMSLVTGTKTTSEPPGSRPLASACRLPIHFRSEMGLSRPRYTCGE